MHIKRGKYGKLIRTWKMRFDSLNVEIKVFLSDGNSRYGRDTCFFAICEEHDLKLRNTDIGKLESETRAMLKLRVTTKWEPWISYSIYFSHPGGSSECGDSGEVSFGLSYQIIDRADIGLSTERFRKMDEHIGMHKELVRNPEQGWGNGAHASAPKMGYETGHRSGEVNPFHLNGVVRDTPANRMALQEVQTKLKQLYEKLARNLEPEHAQNFLFRVANTKLLLPGGEDGKKEKTAKRRKLV